MEDFLAVSSTLLPAAPGRKNVELQHFGPGPIFSIEGGIFTLITPGSQVGEIGRENLAVFRFYVKWLLEML